jgi:hypothetical protein
MDEPQLPTKAMLLAKELQTEKLRLEKELSDLQSEFDDAKSVTPTGTWDWAVKWAAVILAIIGIFVLSAGFEVYGKILYVLSGLAWIYVGMMWQDRAIMIGSSITTTAVLLTLVQLLTK